MQRLILIIFRNEFKIITSIFLMFCWFLVCPRFLWTRRREWKTTMLSCGYFLKKFLLISRWVIWIHTFYWLSSSISSIPCSWTTPTPIWLICSSMTLFFLLYFNTMKYFFVKIDHFFFRFVWNNNRITILMTLKNYLRPSFRPSNWSPEPCAMISTRRISTIDLLAGMVTLFDSHCF